LIKFGIRPRRGESSTTALFAAAGLLLLITLPT